MTALDQTTHRLIDLTSFSGQLPVTSKMAITIAHTVMVWKQQARTRRALAKLTTPQLHDLGLTPAQARTEANKRFWQQ